MFNAGQPEINYIGILTISVQSNYQGFPFKHSDIFPISGLKEISDKAFIFNFFSNEYKKFASNIENGYVKASKVSTKFIDKEEGPNKYTANIIYNSEDNRRGTISFEIFDERKLLEKRDFISSSI